MLPCVVAAPQMSLNILRFFDELWGSARPVTGDLCGRPLYATIAQRAQNASNVLGIRRGAVPDYAKFNKKGLAIGNLQPRDILPPTTHKGGTGGHYPIATNLTGFYTP